jgi:uncharacterized protein
MALEMKAKCEKCLRALAMGSEALVCSYECTFCADCGKEMQHICPNCSGELVRRPRRKARHETA